MKCHIPTDRLKLNILLGFGVKFEISLALRVKFAHFFLQNKTLFIPEFFVTLPTGLTFTTARIFPYFEGNLKAISEEVFALQVL